MKYLLFYFLCLLVFNNAQAQTIEGVIKDNLGAVPGINVLVKKIDNPNLIYQFSKTNENGYYKITLKTPLDSLFIEVNTFNYEPLKIKVNNIQSKGVLQVHNIKLNTSTTDLEEIHVSSSNPIIIKKDTTDYNPKSFMDGSERVVEDLLKKLPGIKVEDNGEIKFKGKSIKKMLLDGDDLFDSQYTIGSKNINIDMLDKVEVIEDYNENKLLKGVKPSEDVALNLKLKKGKNDFSGTVDLGMGIVSENKHNSSITGILLNQKIKSFGLLSYNNVGVNTTPYDFQSNSLSLESISNSDLNSKELINQGNFYSPLSDKFHRINSTFFSSLNTLYKVSKNTTLKLNFSKYSDKLTRENIEETNYDFNNIKFQVLQNENISKSPNLYDLNLVLFNQTSKTLNFEYIGKIEYQEIDYHSFTLNNTIIQKNTLLTKKLFTKHKFNLTKKIGKDKLIISNVLFSKDSAPQFFVLTPGISTSENINTNIAENNQESRFDKTVINVNTEYFNKSDNLSWLLRTGFSGTLNNFTSNLTSKNEYNQIFSDVDYQNNSVYKINIPYLNGSLVYNLKKISFKIGLGSQFYSLTLLDKIRSIYKEQNGVLFSPNAKFVYNISNKSALTLNYKYNQIAPTESNLYSGIVQTGFRNFRNNEPNLEFLKTHTYGLNFNYNDLFNSTYFRFGVNFDNRRNNYFLKTFVNLNTVVGTGFLLNSGNKVYNFNMSSEKYIHFLKTTFQLNSNYTISFDKNIINNSDLRDIQLKNLMIEFITRKGLKSKLVLENKLVFNRNIFQLSGSNENSFSSFNNASNIIYKVKENIRFTTTLNYVFPDISMNKQYYFLDTELKFTSKNKKIDYSIVGRNLTGNKTFDIVNISDFSRTISSHNLIQTFLLGTVSFKF